MRSVILEVCLLGLAACTTPEVAVVTTSGGVVHAVPSTASAVPPGTVVAVRLLDRIDTETTAVGQAFRARVEGPIEAADGHVVVPDGSVLRGRVVSLGTADAPRVRLTLDTIDTIAGPAPIKALVRHAEPRHHAGPEVVAQGRGDTVCGDAGGPGIPFCDSYLDLIHSDTAPQHGFGEPPPTDDRPREVQLPRGARVELVLTEPLASPAARAGRD
jgi:hypothetical protein